MTNMTSIPQKIAAILLSFMNGKEGVHSLIVAIKLVG